MGQEFVADPIVLGQVAQGLLDVLPVRQHTSPEYSYLAQTTRTNNAAVVAEGAAKPTSVYSVVRVEKSLVVVAHLSEGIPRYWLLDNTALETFVDSELRYGLGVSVEAKVLSDVNGTSGIQTQAYSTSASATLRKGLTNVEVGRLHGQLGGAAPDGLGRRRAGAGSTVNAIEHMSLPITWLRRLFGVPIVSTVAQAAGVGHVLASDAVVVDTDTQGVGVQWSETSNTDDFAKNLIRARCEGRFGTSVLSPLGVVTCDLMPVVTLRVVLLVRVDGCRGAGRVAMRFRPPHGDFAGADKVAAHNVLRANASRATCGFEIGSASSTSAISAESAIRLRRWISAASRNWS